MNLLVTPLDLALIYPFLSLGNYLFSNQTEDLDALLTLLKSDVLEAITVAGYTMVRGVLKSSRFAIIPRCYGLDVACPSCDFLVVFGVHSMLKQVFPKTRLRKFAYVTGLTNRCCRSN